MASPRPFVILRSECFTLPPKTVARLEVYCCQNCVFISILSNGIKAADRNCRVKSQTYNFIIFLSRKSYIKLNALYLLNLVISQGMTIYFQIANILTSISSVNAASQPHTSSIISTPNCEKFSNMLNAWRPGFTHAPVTKIIITAVVLCTVFSSIIGSRPRLILLLNPVKDGQIWRLLTHNLIFTTPGELLFGVVLLYYFRQLERQLGSSRFAAFAISVTSFYSLLLLWIQLSNPSFLSASGPYALILASLIHYFYEAPKIYHFQILGTFSLSDKSFIYMATFQFIICYPPLSFTSFLAAIIAGLIFRIPFIRHNADMPDTLVSLSTTYLLPLLGTSPPSSSQSRPSTARLRPLANGAVELSRLSSEDQTLNSIHGHGYVSDANIDTLVSMGFPRDHAVSALQQNGDDVHRAAETLIATSGS